MMDDLWGDDDLDADVVEECVLLATQASICLSPNKTQQQRQEPSFTECKPKNVFEFKQPSQTNQLLQYNQRAASSSSKTNSTTAELHQAEKKVESLEIQQLRAENKKLIETNLAKNGETTILRADIQNLRMIMEKRETQANHQLSSLQKHISQMDQEHTKQLEATKTEMKFKELELEELRNKCKKIEQNMQFSREQKVNVRPAQTTVLNSPGGRKFLKKTSLEIGSRSDRKAIVAMADAGIQTESAKRFRLDSSEIERLDNATGTAVLVETLKFSLLSSASDTALSRTTVLDQLRMRLINGCDFGNLAEIFHKNEPSVAEIICSSLARVKNTDRSKVHIEFLCCWITHILPYLGISKQEHLIQTILSELRRATLIDTMDILSAIVSGFGLVAICNRPSGCHLEKVALSLKDSYLSMSPEDQFQAAQKLVWTLSTMLSSPSSDYLKKCACIPYLLKSLVLVVQHQTELEDLTPYVADRRLKVLVQAFRLSLSILSSRREPWLSFKNSPAEINRLYTVLTLISVEFPIPNDISHEINVSAFTLPGFGL